MLVALLKVHLHKILNGRHQGLQVLLARLALHARVTVKFLTYTAHLHNLACNLKRVLLPGKL